LTARPARLRPRARTLLCLQIHPPLAATSWPPRSDRHRRRSPCTTWTNRSRSTSW
jgi:hypothetical protein